MITIQDTQLKNYFTKEYNEDISFLLLPKNKDTLKTAKEFILNTITGGEDFSSTKIMLKEISKIIYEMGKRN